MILANLERALRDHPDDPEVALVYADAIGETRGEYIVLANLAEPTVEQARRERELRRAALSTTRFARVTWRGGFVERLDVVDLREADSVERLAELLARPEFVRLRELDLRPAWSGRPYGFDVAHVRKLVEDKPLRWLGIGSVNQELDVDAVPQLTGLALAGTNVELAHYGDARDVEVAYDLSTIEQLVVRPMERVVIAGAPDPAIVERFARIPTLRAFGLVGNVDAFNDELVVRLAKSPLLPRLAELGLTAHRFESSNRRLVEHAAKFAHVKLIARPVWEDGWVYAWHDLAHLYETLGRTSEALAEFDALVTFQDDATYWADIGMQLAKLARRDEAMAAHEHATSLDPKCGRAWSGKACLFEDDDRFADALVAWDAAQAAGLADVHTWTHRAWTLMRLDRNDDALVALDAALAIDPEHAWSLENKQKLRSLRGRARRLWSKLWR